MDSMQELPWLLLCIPALFGWIGGVLMTIAVAIWAHPECKFVLNTTGELVTTGCIQDKGLGGLAFVAGFAIPGLLILFIKYKHATRVYNPVAL